MLSEMVRETIRMVGNAHRLAKGPWALGGRDHFWANPDTDAGVIRPESRGEGAGKPSDGGVYVSERLSIVASWEGLFLEGRGQNRIREIRLSGIAGGLAETWSMGA
jgi:hypothetical protein